MMSCKFLLILLLPYLINGQEHYDFIIIGSGPGGATVANRLSEINEWKILLLEAGGEENLIGKIPCLARTIRSIGNHWGYYTEPEKNACFGVNNHQCPWPRGKGLGGSSLINYLIYTRGHLKDYDNWELLGNRGWGWKSVLKYFEKAEKVLNINETYSYPIAKSFFKGGVELGYPLNNCNSSNGTLNGFCPTVFTMRHGLRLSANNAYLTPARQRNNLIISTNSHVTKILINPMNKKVYGVKYFKYGKYIDAFVRNEVILSAGAINTPQILMLSGIGPEEHLRELRIPVVHNLPGVGQNLQDHVFTPAPTFIVNDKSAVIQRRNPISVIDAVIKYIFLKTGPLTNIFADGLAYINSNLYNYPELEIILSSTSLASDGGQFYRKGFEFNEYIYNTAYKPIEDKNSFSIWPMIIKPQSRGEIKLNSNDPFTSPLMYANYFYYNQDLDAMIKGIKFIIKLTSETEAFKQYNTSLNSIPIPHCSDLLFNSDNYWKCVLKILTASTGDQCCTAKMGSNIDRMAVVNHELKVYGIQGLRVVDASVMPDIIAGHTMAPTYMIAEKASDMIKLFYNKTNSML